MSEAPSGDGSSGGRLQPTSAGQITFWAVLGLVLGWLFHPVTDRLLGTAPLVTWSQPLALFLIAGALGATAWSTWRALHVRRERMQPHLAVNRLVLARSSALVGALVAGGYLGYAVSWLGVDVELAPQRAVRAGVAALAGVIVVITALLLERACRVHSDRGAS